VEQVAKVLRVDGEGDRTASQLAEVFGFGPKRQWTPVADLSGGERRRLQLLRLLMEGPNLLVLDEPTNDLDVDTLVQLEDLLDGWPGTLVVVSHDRWFLERVCDLVVSLPGDGSLRGLVGGVAEFLQQRRKNPVAMQGGTPGAAARPVSSAAEIRAAKKEQSRLERAMSKLDEREKKLHADMAAAATDYAKVGELDAQLKTLAAERTEIEDAWMAAAERAEEG
jgi:ATP-binding cassette subfamily F protein uup